MAASAWAMPTSEPSKMARNSASLRRSAASAASMSARSPSNSTTPAAASRAPSAGAAAAAGSYPRPSPATDRAWRRSASTGRSNRRASHSASAAESRSSGTAPAASVPSGRAQLRTWAARGTATETVQPGATASRSKATMEAVPARFGPMTSPPAAPALASRNQPGAAWPSHVSASRVRATTRPRPSSSVATPPSGRLWPRSRSSSATASVRAARTASTRPSRATGTAGPAARRPVVALTVTSATTGRPVARTRATASPAPVVRVGAPGGTPVWTR